MKFCFEKKDFIESDISPNKLAVIGEDIELTWRQFSEKVDQTCGLFIENKFNQLKYPVIIYGHKSSYMIVAIYAMIKLEIPYIPIDLIYPKERISKIIELSKSELIINTSEEKILFEGTNEVLLNSSNIVYNNRSELSVRKDSKNDPLVYIIFTSGSTGEPKGVQITTSAIQSFTRWMTTDFYFSANDVFINSAILSFDLSVFEVMTFAAIGGTILLNDKTTASSPELLLNRIEKYNGSIWVSTPSFAFIYSRIENEPRLTSVNTFLFCGEILPHSTAKKLKEKFNNSRIINTYGPTEATVATTLIEVTENILKNHNPLPVGRSKKESHLLIENGEIIIVGPNVSIGYLNNPKLNAKKFKTIDGLRAFKTGDLGYIENDLLFFTGRNDDLVKLHGYRIELAEITATINTLDYVLQGTAIALERNGTVKKIVSLVALKDSAEKETTEKIKFDLSKTLPHYMIPSDVKLVNRIPLNQNGKIDKNKLVEIYLQS